MNKYELTSETLNYAGRTFHRIRALKDFGYVNAGDLGGWIVKEDNLSQQGTAWVFGEAKVCDNARVDDDAAIHDKACLCCNARVFGHAKVYDEVVIYDSAQVYGCAVVLREARILNNAKIHGNAYISGRAEISDNADIYGNANIDDEALVSDAAIVYGAEVYGNTHIIGDAIIGDNNDYITFKNFWSSGRYFTWTRSNNRWRVGCFYGTGEELIKKAYANSKKSGREYERVVRYVESILADEKKS